MLYLEVEGIFQEADRFLLQSCKMPPWKMVLFFFHHNDQWGEILPWSFSDRSP